MDLFYRDIENGLEITWKQLISDLNESSTYNMYCKSNSYYDVFKNIILSLLIDRSIIILDNDFSDDEMYGLTGFKEFDKFDENIELSKIKLKDKAQLLDYVNNKKEAWNITLYTSGTTGMPKKVIHTFESITRQVRKGNANRECVWGLAYNPTHMAGIQVFFQALLNGNSLVRLFSFSKETVLSEIEINEITNISATPTFYRFLFPITMVNYSVKRITSGGEKFDDAIIKKLKKAFPKAKITNVYASTEAGAIFASSGDVFTVKNNVANLVKIENGELLLHKSLLGENDFVLDEWYYTNDLVKVISNNPLTFSIVSRKNELINIGGYKVNPTEVEDVINEIDGIRAVRVFAKSSSIMGNVLCCEIVVDNKGISEKNIRAYLSGKIQEFKIPRVFKFVDKISLTRTGKVKRN